MKALPFHLLICTLLILPALVAAQTCLTGADNPQKNQGADCNGTVEIDELLSYIDSWYSCSECVPDLFTSIEAYYGIFAQVQKTDSIEQFGITWQFDREYEYGQFANGDYWVIGPVNITGIEPASVVIVEQGAAGCTDQDLSACDEYIDAAFCVSGTCGYNRTINGAMVIESLPSTSQPPHDQGYDSSYRRYYEYLNLARINGRALSADNQLRLEVNKSLISSISRGSSNRYYDPDNPSAYTLNTSAVLTVLGEAPAEGSFRPAFIGTDKSIKFNEDQLNFGMLQELDRLGYVDESELMSMEKRIERPWTMQHGSWSDEGLSPFHNMNRYPGYRNVDLERVALLLNVDWTGSPGFTTNYEYKRHLLLSLVQLGIDTYAAHLAGSIGWPENGGHGNARKWPILFAGVMLDGPAAHPDAAGMAAIGSIAPEVLRFAEDDQTFYVSQSNLDAQALTYSDSYAPERGWADPGSTQWVSGNTSTGLGGVCEINMPDHSRVYSCLGNCGPDARDPFDVNYDVGDFGLPEWCIRNRNDPYSCNRAWNTYYRLGQNPAYWRGFTLSMHLMGIKDLWNNDAFFDYVDRYEQVEGHIRDTAILLGRTATTRTVIEPSIQFNIPGTPLYDTHGNMIIEDHSSYHLQFNFVDDLWNEYRNRYGCVWQYDNITDNSSRWHYNCTYCLNDCLAYGTYCGDGYCDGGLVETQSSCPYDCAVPAPPEPEENCTDGIKNQNETDVDCGGECQVCDIGESCELDSDCITYDCVDSVCVFNPTEISALFETDEIQFSGDTADDPAIWLHPTDPALSTVIGTNKNANGGLVVYDLAGNQLQFTDDGRMNNVDARYDFPFGGGTVDIAATNDRNDGGISVYSIDPVTRELTELTGGGIITGMETYGFCLYHSPVTGDYFAFVNDKDGTVQQWRLFDDGNGHVDGTLVRTFDVGSQPEGMVADDELGELYVGEEVIGIWKYGAEPSDGSSRVSVDSVGSGHLTADVEGLAIYFTSDGSGYLIASSQGDNSFSVYERLGGNDFVMNFDVVSNSVSGIDGLSDTDGIEVISTPLGSGFPYGLFVAQDGSNTNPSQNQNFKLVPWERIAGSVFPQLTIDTGWDPR